MTSPGDDRLDERLVSEAAAALPPRRDDEPASLRQDILDELGDHLACAFRRELLRTNGDAARAETNVRQCFGNPATVARRLWFDSMKGKLMAQKILIGTCAVVVAACVLFGVLLWQTVEASHTATAAMLRQSQEANAALLEQSQATNAALMKQIESLRKTASAPDPQWNPVKIRVVTGSEDGPPAEGVSVYLSPKSNTSGLAANGTTGADGIADMGLVQPGAYELSVNTPAKAWFKESLAVRAGRETSETIVCPPAPASMPIQWAVSWPEELLSHPDRDEMWCVVGIQRDRYQRVSGHESWMNTEEDQRLFAFHPDGREIDLLEVEPPTWWEHPEMVLAPRSSGAGPPLDVSALQRVYAKLLSDFDRLRDGIRKAHDERDDRDRVPAGARYQVAAVSLVRWDGEGSPLVMLAGIKSTNLHDNSWGFLWPIATHRQSRRLPGPPSIEVPAESRPDQFAWTIPISAGLLTEEARWETPTVFGRSNIELRTDAAKYRPPVEAPQPARAIPRFGPGPVAGTSPNRSRDIPALSPRVR